VPGHAQQAADAACAIEAAAEVHAPRIRDLLDAVGIALLQEQEAVVDVTDFVGPVPGAADPVVIAADALAAEPVVTEIRLPQVGDEDVGQAILTVVLEGAGAVVGEIAIGVVLEGDRGRFVVVRMFVAYRP